MSANAAMRAGLLVAWCACGVAGCEALATFTSSPSAVFDVGDASADAPGDAPADTPGDVRGAEGPSDLDGADEESDGPRDGKLVNVDAPGDTTTDVRQLDSGGRERGVGEGVPRDSTRDGGAVVCPTTSASLGVVAGTESFALLVDSVGTPHLLVLQTGGLLGDYAPNGGSSFVARGGTSSLGAPYSQLGAAITGGDRIVVAVAQGDTHPIALFARSALTTNPIIGFGNPVSGSWDHVYSIGLAAAPGSGPTVYGLATTDRLAFGPLLHRFTIDTSTKTNALCPAVESASYTQRRAELSASASWVAESARQDSNAGRLRVRTAASFCNNSAAGAKIEDQNVDARAVLDGNTLHVAKVDGSGTLRYASLDLLTFSGALPVGAAVQSAVDAPSAAIAFDATTASALMAYRQASVGAVWAVTPPVVQKKQVAVGMGTGQRLIVRASHGLLHVVFSTGQGTSINYYCVTEP